MGNERHYGKIVSPKRFLSKRFKSSDTPIKFESIVSLLRTVSAQNVIAMIPRRNYTDFKNVFRRLQSLALIGHFLTVL